MNKILASISLKVSYEEALTTVVLLYIKVAEELGNRAYRDMKAELKKLGITVLDKEEEE